MLILFLGVCPSETGPRPIGRRLPNWGVPSCLTMISVPMQAQGAYATSKKKHATDLCIL